MTKPTLFIGSSTEGLPVANAIQHNLEFFAEVTIWTQDLFKLSIPIITSLFKSLSRFDFAIFVFSPDDIQIIREEKNNVVRDNVIFETGLFAGKLGFERVFLVRPRGMDMHLPSDMLGIVIGQYEANRADKNLIAATGTFCNQVKNSITEILSSQKNEKKESQNFIKDLKIIETYLVDNNWTQISVEKLKENVNLKYTEEYLTNLIEEFPEKLRRCKVRGLSGIKLIGKLKIISKPDERIEYSPYTRLMIHIEVSLRENMPIIQEKINKLNPDFHFATIHWSENTFELHCKENLTNESLMVYKLRDILKDFRLRTIEIVYSTKKALNDN